MAQGTVHRIMEKSKGGLTMREAIILIGLPASGKSSLARALENAIRRPSQPAHDAVATLSLDTFRHIMCPTHSDENGERCLLAGSYQKAYIDAYNAAIKSHASHGSTIILDNTHTTWRSIRNSYDTLVRLGYHVTFVRMDADVEECVKRDALREGTERVGESAIRRMATQLESLNLPDEICGKPVTMVRVAADETASVAALNRRASSICRLMTPYAGCEYLLHDVKHVIVIGDVHSAAARLERLELQIDEAESPLVVFAGDLLDRGDDPVGTMAVIRRIRSHHPTLFVTGNHDMHALRILKQDPLSEGRFEQTRASIDALSTHEPEDYISDLCRITSIMREATCFRAGDKRFVVTHGGITEPYARDIAETDCIPLRMTSDDLIYGCAMREGSERGGLYRRAHGSDYSNEAIEAVRSPEHVVQVHGHRAWKDGRNLPWSWPAPNHYDLESEAWLERGCLTSLWVDVDDGRTTIMYTK